MKLNGLLDLAHDLPALRDLAAELAAGRVPGESLEVYHAARPYLIAALARVLNQPLLVITPRSNRARQWVDELRTWLPDEVPVHNFADPDALPYERIPWAPETRQRRLEALVSLLTVSDSLARGQATVAPIVVSSARALVQMTLPVREMRLALRQIKQGQAFDLNKVLANWVGLGYESEAVVETPGVFSRRGGIVDIWPPNLRKPIRIELFGDEIDSLRTFDPSTQRTLARVEQAWIGPASEALPRLAERGQDRLNSLDFSGCHPPARTEFEKELTQLRAGSGFRNLEWYIPYLYSQPGSLVDYLPGQAAWLIVEDTPELVASFNDLAGQAEQLARDLRAAGDVPAVLAAPYFAPETLRERLAARPSLSLGAELLDPARGNGHDPAAVSNQPGSRLANLFSGGPRYGGQMRAILTEIERHLHAGDRIVMVSRQAPRLAELVRETGHAVVPADNIPDLPPPGLTLVQGVMEEGWKLEARSWKLETGGSESSEADKALDEGRRPGERSEAAPIQLPASSFRALVPDRCGAVRLGEAEAPPAAAHPRARA